MSDSDVKVVYEDDDIKLLHKPGQSDFLLVTFGDLTLLADGNRFYADDPVEKLSLSCLGFMAKQANWFPSASVLSAISAAAGILDGFRVRVAHGGSMGAHAAIKFSAALGATEVIALCPQWSLDRGECDGVDPGWQGYFEPRMTGMGIRGEDTSGRVFVFADTFDATDSFHVSRIMPTLSQGWLIKLPFVAHQVQSVLAGTANFAALIDLARKADLDGMRRLVRGTRKDSYYRIAPLLVAGMARHRDLTFRVLCNYRNLAPAREKLFAVHYGAAMMWLVERGEAEWAAALAVRFAAHARYFEEYVRRWFFAANLLGRGLALIDYRGNAVTFDLLEEGLWTRRHVDAPSNIPPVVSLQTTVVMEIQTSVLRAQLGADEIGRFRPTKSATRSAGRVEFSGGEFSLWYHTGYMSSLPDGSIMANREAATEREKFRFALTDFPRIAKIRYRE